MVADNRRFFDDVLLHDRGVLGIALTFAPTGVRTPSPVRPHRRKSTPVTVAQVGQLCTELHAVHEFALMLMRLTGLRISEVYRLRVGNTCASPSGSAAGSSLR